MGVPGAMVAVDVRDRALTGLSVIWMLGGNVAILAVI